MSYTPNSKPDIVDVISRYIPLKRVGASFAGICPFHPTRTFDAFRVSPALQIFKCFNCGATGDVIKFIMLIEKTDFKGALRILEMESSKVVQRCSKVVQKNGSTLFKGGNLLLERMLEVLFEGKEIP
jgi:DNA primase